MKYVYVDRSKLLIDDVYFKEMYLLSQKLWEEGDKYNGAKIAAAVMGAISVKERLKELEDLSKPPELPPSSFY